jgi:hypothetical protein
MSDKLFRNWFKLSCLILIDPKDEATGKITSLQMNDELFYYFGLTSSGGPLLDIKVDEYQPCNNMSESNISPNRSDPQILKVKRIPCESGSDWTILDSV